MKWLRTALVGLTSLSWALSALPVDAGVAGGAPPACHGYYAVAHTGDFDLGVCREGDRLVDRFVVVRAIVITGDSRYVEDVTVVYQP
jgi:hypothetical protein